MNNRGTIPHLLLICGAVVMLGAAVIAAIDSSVSGRVYALGAVGLILALAGLAALIHASTRHVVGAVEQAPRDQYFRGYGDAAEDALRDP